MRIAVVSDIHANLTAFEAVLADLRETAPDLIFHGGDLAHGGASPVEIVDRVRDLGWQGVLGNTDEMLPMPETLTAFASQSPPMQALLPVIEKMAAVDRELLGEERIAWLATLPRKQVQGPMALVHASPDTTWNAPGPEATDAELEAVYWRLAHPLVVYGHIHRSFIRRVGPMTVVNAGSVSLSYDGDPRAAYLLLDDSQPSIRRVEYDLDRERKLLAASRIPHSDWVAKMLADATFRMP